MNAPLCRASDPITSFMAADRVKEFKAAHHEKIITVLRTSFWKALGAEQIADLTGLDAYQIRKRLPELQKRGMVQPYQQTRKTATGRHERLWGAV
jgi:predicted ArsR family transcriptional regulator